MSRALRTLLFAQLAVLLVGVAVVAEAELPLAAATSVTVPMPKAVPAAVRVPVRPAVVRPVVKPKPVVTKKAPKKRVVKRSVRKPVATAPVVRRTTAPVVVPASSAQQRMEQAVARIPGYVPGSTKWVLEAKDGYWGTADWYDNTIYISPKVPANRIYDVVTHEWSHVRSVQVYGGSVRAATDAMNKYFGGTGLEGPERAADCMARKLGAGWTHYTTCPDASWKAGAAKLLSGSRL